MERVLLRSVLILSARNTIPPLASILHHSPNTRNDGMRRYSSGDDDNKSDKSKERLNNLLQSIIQDSKERKERGEVPKVDYKLAVPIREKRIRVQKEKVEAVDASPKEPELSPQLLSAVKSVAADLAGDPQTTENDLVQKLKTQQTEKINLSELFLGMKIDRTQKPSPVRSTESEGSRAQRVRQLLNEENQQPHHHRRYQERPPRPERRMQPSPGYSYAPIDLFGSRPLGIFKAAKKTSSPAGTPTLATWDAIHQRELKLAATHPPANGFEEMILWTEQGKFWHFPIDNEQGNDENSKFDFTDHVFLEPVIESWCPKKGPIRHFMELVTVALSKNPYLTVPEKREYLNWYHEYFKGKSHILKEVGADEIH